MKEDNGITAYNADTGEGGIGVGKEKGVADTASKTMGQYYSSVKAESREALFAGIVLGLGFAVAALEVLNQIGMGINLFDMGHMTREIIVLSIALYGTIQVPRLEAIPDSERIILMMLHAGMLLMYLPQMTPEYGMVASAAFGLLFISSMINAFGQREAEAAKITMKKHAAEIGMLGVGAAFLIGYL